MEAKQKSVFIVGGTGFIGYHAVQEFLTHGWRVTILALCPPKKEMKFPRGVKILVKNLAEVSDARLEKMLTGFDAAVFAAGADDRVVPKAPAYPFFHKMNVEAAQRFFRVARNAGVKRGVLLSSYFAHFARVWPTLKLADAHPYIRSRIAQEKTAVAASKPGLKLVILELPYIFGSTPGNTPLWKSLLKYLQMPGPAFYPKGGTNAVSVANVGRAIYGAVEYGVPYKRYVVGDQNMLWTEMLGRLAAAMGKKKRIISVPNWIVKFGLFGMHVWHKLHGKEGGLNLTKLADLQTANTYFDPAEAMKELHYKPDDLDNAFRETVKASHLKK